MGGEFIQAILANFAQLLPFRIVMSYSQAVRWTWGIRPKALGPGIHWCIWLIHHIHMLPAVEEVVRLPKQSVTTKDGKPVIFSVNVGQKVVDPVKHLCNVHDFDGSSRDLAMTHLARRVSEKTYAELAAGLADLENSLKGTLSTKWRDWGTEVTRVGFTDFVMARHQIRMFGDMPNLN